MNAGLWRWWKVCWAAAVVTMMRCARALGTCDREELRRRQIAQFVHDRAELSLLCAYAFDRIQSNALQPTIEEITGTCPFGALAVDPATVQSLNRPETHFQLGVRLHDRPEDADPNITGRHDQLRSLDVIRVQQFYEWAMKAKETGVTFEIVFRRRHETNVSMTLFSVSNEYSHCADPGFRLDVTEDQVPKLIYYVSVLGNNTDQCYEEKVEAKNILTEEKCRLPPFGEPNPVIHIVVTLKASEDRNIWSSDFYVQYVDPITMKMHECRTILTPGYVHATAKLFFENFRGVYRLYIGNNPRSGKLLKSRRPLMAQRAYRDPHEREPPPNATERLRRYLYRKVMSIEGPQLPDAVRVFKNRSFTVAFLGTTFPPFNEETPFKWMRSQVKGFLGDYGPNIVDLLMRLLLRTSKAVNKAKKVFREELVDRLQNYNSSQKPKKAFGIAESASTFDVFHFALYNHSLKEVQVEKLLQKLSPFRDTEGRTKTIRVKEDTPTMVDLQMLHSVYDDITVNLQTLPEYGRIFTFSDRQRITSSSMADYWRQDKTCQQYLWFEPQEGLTNDNLPIPYSFARSRRRHPYSNVTIAVKETTSGRDWYAGGTGAVEIYVDRMRDVLRVESPLIQIDVMRDHPILFTLNGKRMKITDSSQPRGNIKTTGRKLTEERMLSVRLLSRPRFGVLYDSSFNESDTREVMTSQAADGFQQMVAHRIHHLDDKISSPLVYVFRAWGESSSSKDGDVVDTFQYQLVDGKEVSDVGTVKFRLHVNSSDITNEEVENAVDLNEDAVNVLKLGVQASLANYTGIKKTFIVSKLPTNGVLFQYRHQSVEGNNTCDGIGICVVGDQISSSDTQVSDPEGRLVFVPRADYSNAHRSQQAPNVVAWKSDTLEFMVQVPPTAAVTSITNSSHVIELRVLNQPDNLRILPPRVIKTTLLRGDFVSIAAAFEDPDYTAGTYQLTLDAADDKSAFVFPFEILDEDIDESCGKRRPCDFRTNCSQQISGSDGAGCPIIRVSQRIFDPSHVIMIANKSALTRTLSYMSFRDLTHITWFFPHRSEFNLNVTNLNATAELGMNSASTTFIVKFAAMELKRGGIFFAGFLNHLRFYILAWAITFVAANTSCCIAGCACCSSRARQKKRQQFEESRRRFIDETVQNDQEYSILICAFRDVFSDPTLCASSNIYLKSSKLGGARNDQQLLFLTNLLLILESDGQALRFIAKLLLLECERLDRINESFLEYPSRAGLALAYYNRWVGCDWLKELRLNDIFEASLARSHECVNVLLEQMEELLKSLPVEVMLLCQVCAGIFAQKSSIELAGVHAILFNHYIGPALHIASSEKLGTGDFDRIDKVFKEVAQVFVQMDPILTATSNGHTLDSDATPATTGHELLDTLTSRYHGILRYILNASVSYEWKSTDSRVTDDQLAIALMNIHSFCDTFIHALESEPPAADCSSDCHPCASNPPSIQLNRFLRALNFPYASACQLVASLRLSNDLIVSSGYSTREWKARGSVSDTQPTSNSEKSPRTTMSVYRALSTRRSTGSLSLSSDNFTSRHSHEDLPMK